MPAPTLDMFVKEGELIVEPQHICVFGAPGVGKTTLIGELAARGYHLIFFDLDNGRSSLFKLPKEALANIEYIKIHDTRETPNGHITVDNIIRGGRHNLCETHGRINCPECRTKGAPTFEVEIPTKDNKTIVVIDSGSQLTASIISSVLLKKPIDYQETLHDFRNQGNYLTRILGFMQVAPFNVIVTAHEIEGEQEDGSKKLFPSIGTTKYAPMVGKFFDAVIHMKVSNGKHSVHSSTGYSNYVPTHSRLGIAIESLPTPSLAPFFEGVQAGVQPANETIKAQAQTTLTGLTKLNSLSALNKK